MTFHKWMVGFFLTAIMLAALSINAVLFSARSFQYNIAQSSSTANALIDVDRLQEVDRQISAIRGETQDTRGAAIQAQREVETVSAAIGALETEINTLRANITGELVAVEAGAGAAVAEAASMLDAAALAGRLGALAQRPNLSAEHQQRIAALRGQIDRLTQLEANLAEADRRRATSTAQQRLVDGQVAEANRRILALQQSVVPSVDHYDRIVGEVEALRNSSPLNVGVTLVGMHPAFVSTLLVLLMGALGAILYLFPAYMSRPNPVTFAEIVVRMLFGMCAALAFYIVANATLAGFSFTPTAGGAAPATSAAMNPFTVSLIGIVAGVMADDLAAWIKNRGGEIFRGGAPSNAPATGAQPQSNTVTATATASSPVNEHGGAPGV